MALTSLEYVLLGLNIQAPSQADRDRYDQLRQSAEAAIKVYLKWPVEEATVTEFYDGSGQPILALRYPWVSGITNVWLDPTGAYGDGPNAFATSTLLTAGTQYVLKKDWTENGVAYSKEGGLVCLATPTAFAFWWPSDLFWGAFGGRRGLSFALPAYWPKGWGIIKVTLTYGFSTANFPLDLKTAVVESVAIFNNSNMYGGILTSESLARYSYQLSMGQEFGGVRQLLSRWRDTAI